LRLVRSEDFQEDRAAGQGKVDKAELTGTAEDGDLGALLVNDGKDFLHVCVRLEGGNDDKGVHGFSPCFMLDYSANWMYDSLGRGEMKWLKSHIAYPIV
jgi:hypothetical protein